MVLMMSDPSPPAEASPATRPRSYLAWSVIAAIACFLPLGLVAVLYGIRTDRAVLDGRPVDAARLSRRARGWLIATVLLGVLVYAVLTAALVMLGAFSS
jgi:hypothetical protein